MSKKREDTMGRPIRKCNNTIDDIEGLTKKYEVEKVPTIVIDSPRGIYRHTGTDIAGYYNLLRSY